MAVYTEVTDDQLEAFVGSYDLGRILSCKGIAEGVENSNYLLHVERGYFILTLYEKRVEEKDLPFFLGLMEHLSTRGLTCPQPVKNREGNALGNLCGRRAAIVTFLDGVWHRRPEVRHCAALGEALGKLHKAGADFTGHRANTLTLTQWPRLFETVALRADDVQQGLASFISDELDFLHKSWPVNLPAGIIHADLFPDNVLFLGDALSGLIDFYFACTDFFVYDLAICLNAWCFEPDLSFNITKGMALFSGYERMRKLQPVEIEALPVLVRGAALRFGLTRLVDWLNRPEGAMVRPKDPLEYVEKLRFHRKIESARELGLLR
jgi:homoserine kinase type II